MSKAPNRFSLYKKDKINVLETAAWLKNRP